MKPDFSNDPMNTQGDVTQGGGMMKRMIARNGPARGTKEYFATLQKQGRIKRGGAKNLSAKKAFGSLKG
jgi:hypothetical protein